MTSHVDMSIVNSILFNNPPIHAQLIRYGKRILIAPQMATHSKLYTPITQKPSKFITQPQNLLPQISKLNKMIVEFDSVHLNRHQSDKALLLDCSVGKAQTKRFSSLTSCHGLITSEISFDANLAEAPEGFKTLAN